jgi:hypothetical protein
VVVEQASVGSIHYTTIARILADASLQPHRSRYWKTATIDERFTTRAAKILWIIVISSIGAHFSRIVDTRR